MNDGCNFRHWITNVIVLLSVYVLRTMCSMTCALKTVLCGSVLSALQCSCPATSTLQRTSKCGPSCTGEAWTPPSCDYKEQSCERRSQTIDVCCSRAHSCSRTMDVGTRVWLSRNSSVHPRLADAIVLCKLWRDSKRSCSSAHSKHAAELWLLRTTPASARVVPHTLADVLALRVWVSEPLHHSMDNAIHNHRSHASRLLRVRSVTPLNNSRQPLRLAP